MTGGAISTKQSSERLIRLPEPWLDAEACHGLNVAFYSVEPHDYFQTRLELLMLAAADTGAILAAFQKGLEYGALKIGGPEVKAPDDAEAAQNAFVTADAVNLLHHISETLLRLYFAHRPEEGKFPASPWLQIAQEVTPGEFKRLVALRFGGNELDDARRAEVTATFYGSADPPCDTPEEADRLRASVDEIERFLHHFARYFLDEAKLYNAMKHGLAIRPGSSSMHLNTPADAERLARGESPLISAEGPSVEYLARKNPEDEFGRETRWVRPDVLMGEALIAVFMLAQIWTIGKLRYIGPDDPSRKVPLRFYDHTPLNGILDAYLGDNATARFVIRTMRMSLGYAYAYPPELECTGCSRGPRDDEKRPRRRWYAVEAEGSPLKVLCPECGTAWRKARAIDKS